MKNDIKCLQTSHFFPIQEAKSRMKAQGEEPTKGTRLSGWETGQKGWRRKQKGN